MWRKRIFLLVLATSAAGHAQHNRFAGGYLGISTLSADARTDVTSTGARFSSYKPENGPTAVGFAGRHINDFFSVMGSYGWNRNSVLLASGEAAAAALVSAQDYQANMHAFIGEGMLYFRARRSRIRPYLTAGAGITHTEASVRGKATAVGNPPPPPTTLSKTGPAFRVAVGIDLFVSKRVAFRYSFSETLQGNSFSENLNPQGSRKLANFQNWLGLAFYF